MERIINYSELPKANGESIYLRMETDPKLYVNLLAKGYKVVNKTIDTNESTIYITGRRQCYNCQNSEEFKDLINKDVQSELLNEGIVKPKTVNFSFQDLLNYKYQLPFVLKNENQNGGKEKFLINTEEDYENLIKACKFLLNRSLMNLVRTSNNDIKYHIDYENYLDSNFTVQDFIPTPSEYNTTVRLLTSASDDLLYGVLKYNKPESYIDNTTLLGYLLKEVFPLSTKSIVSNTLAGGENILIGEDYYNHFEKNLLDLHNITAEQFYDLIKKTSYVHKKLQSELGIICGFDYIYDKNNNKWYLLEYHSRPMVGDYSRRQNISYQTKEEKITAEGRVRATALSLVLKKSR